LKTEPIRVWGKDCWARAPVRAPVARSEVAAARSGRHRLVLREKGSVAGMS
jgi:hypothetical protein